MSILDFAFWFWATGFTFLIAWEFVSGEARAFGWHAIYVGAAAFWPVVLVHGLAIQWSEQRGERDRDR